MAEYIARISYGKDSLKMLEVIHSRGLPLDRITTTDVWATDTISANLPPMDEFKARMDQRIWELYHIEVEHLCARNKDGSKKTYEQMFYHVPVRRSQIGQVERERETVPSRLDPRISGHPASVVPSCIEKGSHPPTDRYRDSRSSDGLGVGENSNVMFQHPPTGKSKAFPESQEPNGARNSSSSRNNGFPAQISPWCRKLKIDKVKTPFSTSAAPQCAKTEMLWNTSESPLMSRNDLDSSTAKSVRPWSSSELTRICAVCTASITICWLRPMKPHAVTVVGSATTRVLGSYGSCAETIPTSGHC